MNGMPDGLIQGYGMASGDSIGKPGKKQQAKVGDEEHSRDFFHAFSGLPYGSASTHTACRMQPNDHSRLYRLIAVFDWH